MKVLYCVMLVGISSVFTYAMASKNQDRASLCVVEHRRLGVLDAQESLDADLIKALQGDVEAAMRNVFVDNTRTESILKWMLIAAENGKHPPKTP